MTVFDEFATRAIRGDVLTREQCGLALDCPDEDLLALLHAAYAVRRRYFGNRVHIQVLSNAKSGLCPEDCHYCSQSCVSTAEIERYPLIPEEQLLAEARCAAGLGAKRFCMALSGRTLSQRELERLCAMLQAIKAEMQIELCGSLGFLDDGQAAQLKAAGLDRVNHNLNTSERFHPNICTTHSYRDRLDTIARCRAAGLEICSGGIVGQGESHDDIIDMFLALREIRPESIPVNFLMPVKGTPFEDRGTDLTPRFCLKVLCLARFLNPDREIRAAGGREANLRSLQPLALYAVNSIFVEGYLTTGGQSAAEAIHMVRDAGFEIELEGAACREGNEASDED